MSLAGIIWNNLVARPLSTALSLVLFALGISVITIMLLAGKQIQEKLDNNLADIDLVVGAKGSPMQIILSSIYHVDFPTGNIPVSETVKISKNPFVEKTIPLALGDSYETYRIVGTDRRYATLYGGELAEGKLWSKNLEVTVGADVARRLKLKIGSTFAGAHGLSETEDMHVHEDMAYEVVGIFKRTNSVLDQLILTNVSSVWEVHAGEAKKGEDPTQELTALLVFYKGPRANFIIPNLVDKSTTMKAAQPAQEITKLFSMMGVGMDAIEYLAYIIIVVSGFSVFISLYSSLKRRQYDLALMRILGASRLKLFFIILLEGLTISLVGYTIGIALSHFGIFLLSGELTDAYRYSFSADYFIIEEVYLLAGSLLLGLVASLIPAIKAFSTDISRTIANTS